MREQKQDRSVFSSVVIDKKNKVSHFNMIGWTDPNTPNPGRAINWLKSLTHDTYVYPADTFDKEQSPVCIFVPEDAMMNKMIETVAKF